MWSKFWLTTFYTAYIFFRDFHFVDLIHVGPNKCILRHLEPSFFQINKHLQKVSIGYWDLLSEDFYLTNWYPCHEHFRPQTIIYWQLVMNQITNQQAWLVLAGLCVCVCMYVCVCVCACMWWRWQLCQFTHTYRFNESLCHEYIYLQWMQYLQMIMPNLHEHKQTVNHIPPESTQLQ